MFFRMDTRIFCHDHCFVVAAGAVVVVVTVVVARIFHWYLTTVIYCSAFYIATYSTSMWFSVFKTSSDSTLSYIMSSYGTLFQFRDDIWKFFWHWFGFEVLWQCWEVFTTFLWLCLFEFWVFTTLSLFHDIPVSFYDIVLHVKRENGTWHLEANFNPAGSSSNWRKKRWVNIESRSKAVAASLFTMSHLQRFQFFVGDAVFRISPRDWNILSHSVFLGSLVLSVAIVWLVSFYFRWRLNFVGFKVRVDHLPPLRATLAHRLVAWPPLYGSLRECNFRKRWYLQVFARVKNFDLVYNWTKRFVSVNFCWTVTILLPN